VADFKQNYFQRRTKDKGPKSNNRITAPEVQVIGSDGENIGIINTNEAISMAKEQGLDLIEIASLVFITPRFSPSLAIT
jgi:translation initiation factor IF-3